MAFSKFTFLDVAAIVFASGLLGMLGCIEKPPNKQKVLKVADPSVIEEFGETWTSVGLATDGEANSYRLSMMAIEYSSEDSNIRLLELLPRKSEGVFARILRVQKRRNGRWIDHGQAAEWLLNGEHEESFFLDNQRHGMRRLWYQNGQLKIEDEWVHGEEHGRARGWYEDGSPKFDAQYSMGKEIQGKAWREDGTEY